MYIHIFGIAEYWGTQSMYSSDHVFCDLYIYMHVDAHFLMMVFHLYARGCAF